MADQNAGIKETKKKLSRMGELAESTVKFGKRMLGMGDVKSSTGRAAGNSGGGGRMGGYRPYDTRNKADMERRERESRAKLEKERRRREGKR